MSGDIVMLKYISSLTMRPRFLVANHCGLCVKSINYNMDASDCFLARNALFKAKNIFSTRLMDI